jgi:diketogulonate reductase-like aldo/keto reductase
VDTVVQRIASEIGATEDQVLMKWAHRVTYGGVIVTTSSKKERLTGQIKALTEMRELTEAQIRGIVEAGAQKHQRVYSQGMEHMDE